MAKIEQATSEEILEERVRKLVERANIIKETLAQKLLDKSLSLEYDKRTAQFSYVTSSILRSLDIIYLPDPTLVAACDNKHLYIGPLFELVLKKYGTKVGALLLLHEALHVMYAHPQRQSLADDKYLYNIVADLYVNTLLENRLRVTIPDDFITLRSFAEEVAGELALPEDKLEILRALADKVVNDELTVEQVYNILSSIPRVVEFLVETFKEKKFFGHDIIDTDNQRVGQGGAIIDMSDYLGASARQLGDKEKQPESGADSGEQGGGEDRGYGGGEGTSAEKEEKADKGKGGAEKRKDEGKQRKTEGTGVGREKEGEHRREGAEGESSEDNVEVSMGEAVEEGGELLEKIREIRITVEELLEDLHRAIGEYNALMKVRTEKPTTTYGTVPGVMGLHEYTQLKALSMMIEVQFLSEVGETISDTMITYTRHDDDAYWLPAMEDIPRRVFLALVDASPSIPSYHLSIFLNMIEKTIRTYDVEVMMSVFSVGEVDYKVLTQDLLATERQAKLLLSVRRGMGTVWDESIADRIEEAIEKGVRLIEVLSDFYIGYSPVAKEAIMRFKRVGGKVSCWSSSGNFADFCDFRHLLPMLARKQRRH